MEGKFKYKLLHFFIKTCYDPSLEGCCERVLLRVHSMLLLRNTKIYRFILKTLVFTALTQGGMGSPVAGAGIKSSHQPQLQQSDQFSLF